jgi:hypothetical protein
MRYSFMKIYLVLVCIGLSYPCLGEDTPDVSQVFENARALFDGANRGANILSEIPKTPTRYSGNCVTSPPAYFEERYYSANLTLTLKTEPGDPYLGGGYWFAEVDLDSSHSAGMDRKFTIRDNGDLGRDSSGKSDMEVLLSRGYSVYLREVVYTNGQRLWMTMHSYMEGDGRLALNQQTVEYCYFSM